jgi:ribosomal protein S12 methylthiotransferase
VHKLQKKIGLVSLGCPKNLVDSEIMLGLLNKEKYIITSDKSDAEILIVNTCGFIESAKKESINTILEMAECKKDKCKLLIVTGCLAQRYEADIKREIPEVDAVLGTGNYGEIAQVINALEKGEEIILKGGLQELDYLKNERMVSTNKGYAYLKIAEGCDNCCTYCIIPSLRGKYRSRKIEDLLEEAKLLTKNGAKEIILIAQDTTRYGIDIYKERKLVELIRKISEISEVEWIRLLYCYPEEIDDNLINEIAENEKVCKYIDIPIQHASDKILAAMGRRGKSIDIENLLVTLRKKVKDIIIRTSLIVGFPGEDVNDFEVLSRFIGKFKFDRLGIFIYSKEEGTPAAKLKLQVSSKEKKKRFNLLMALQKEIMVKSNINRVNKVYKTLVEGISEDGIFYYGRTYAEAPEIDGTIYFTSHEPLEAGNFVNIKILNSEEYDLVGAASDESC